MIDLRCGDWRTVLADVGEVDCLIADPPYGARTHAGNQNMSGRFNLDGHAPRRDLTYAHWTPDDVREFVAHWSPRVRGWMACMTDTDLIPVWREAYAAAGRLDFAPVPCLQHRPRMTGDGPGSGTIYLMVARPRHKRFLGWGSLPCWYGPIMAPAVTTTAHIGGKPMAWMHAIVNDYSRPGDLICDPCAGGATTLIAAHQAGRNGIGSELDPETYAKAKARVDTVLSQPLLFGESPAKSVDLLAM